VISLRSFSLVCLAAAAIGSAHAQLVTSLQLSKSQYVAGEPIIAQIAVTNHSGQELLFRGDTRLPWIDFVVKSASGNPVSARGQNVFGSQKLPAGGSMKTDIDLGRYYLLAESGNYSVSAIVRNPDARIDGVATNKVFFTVSPGRPYWTQKVGILGKPGETREYRLLNFSAGQNSQFYVQVIDDRTGRSLTTFPLGDALLVRKPMTTVDRQQHMHVLYLGTPTMWVHCEVDTDGKLVNRQIHQRGAQGDPQLLTQPDGSVSVGNSIPYDPKAVAEARAKLRKISDRPSFIYE